MFQSYKYWLFALIRNKEQIFWSLFFPILLGTFFYYAFGALGEAENFTQIPVAIVEETESSQLTESFHEMITELSKGDDALIKPEYLSLTDAKERLADGEIVGIFQLTDDIRLIVGEEGVNQSILQLISDRFLQISSTLSHIASARPDLLEQAMSNIYNDIAINQEITIGRGETNIIVYYFYVLLAMACFNGAHCGLQQIIGIQADISPLAARRSISPTKKINMIIADFLAGVTVQFLLVLVSILYFVFVLNINFGDQLSMVVLTSLIGCFVGVSFGTFFGAVIKADIKVREGLLTGISLLLYFLSGLMSINIRMSIRESAPILDSLNPVTLLSDAFYSLSVYGTYDHYLSIFIKLVMMIVFFCVISAVALRRKRYASI